MRSGWPPPEVYETLFPEKAGTGSVYPDFDWESVHCELAREGVTLKRLHTELSSNPIW